MDVNTSVADALSREGWWLDRSRSRSLVIREIKRCLPDPNLILNSVEDDVYVWKPNGDLSNGTFSTSETWSVLHPPDPQVLWHKMVWFSGRVLKHAFLTWVAARDRLGTRDRLLSWGLHVPAVCVLCNGGDETRQHLFFDCPYSNEVWCYFTSRIHLGSPIDFEEVLRWMVLPSRNSNVATIMKLLFQASLYYIWRERNSRLHTDVARSPSYLIGEIKNLMRLKLDPMSRAQRVLVGGLSLLATWFENF